MPELVVLVVLRGQLLPASAEVYISLLFGRANLSRKPEGCEDGCVAMVSAEGSMPQKDLPRAMTCSAVACRPKWKTTICHGRRTDLSERGMVGTIVAHESM